MESRHKETIRVDMGGNHYARNGTSLVKNHSSSQVWQAPVAVLSRFLYRIRVFSLATFITDDKSSKSSGSSFAKHCCVESKYNTLITCVLNFYYLLAVAHAVPHVAETLMGYSAFAGNSSLMDIRNILFNSRYSFMLIKSVTLLVTFRLKTRKILRLAAKVVIEFRTCSLRTQKLIYAYCICVIVGVMGLMPIWEIMDVSTWDTDFDQVWVKLIPIRIFATEVKLWIILVFWWTLASPLIFFMNIAMIFYSTMILSLYCSWSQMNRQFKSGPKTTMMEFSTEWDRLSMIAEEMDDVLSNVIFVSWVADAACAVAYLGSIVIYGAGSRVEQSCTLLGLFIHAVWNPGCYAVPCILFDEEVARTRRIVVHGVSQVTNAESWAERTQRQSMEANLLLQKVAYRPVAFTAWKFFYVTRNVILTMVTILVSYALVIVQMVGQRYVPNSPHGDNTTSPPNR